MRKIILLLNMLLLANLFLSSVEALDDKKPSLMVVYQRDNDAINPDDTLKVDIYFPGDGNISLARCSCYYNIEYYDKIIYSASGSENKSFPLEKGIVPTFQIPNDIFSSAEDFFWSPTLAERGHNIGGSGPTLAPLRMWLDTKSDIPSGDHYLTLLLSYTDGKEWFTYEKNIEFHVNDFIEEHKTEIQLGIPIMTFILGIIIDRIIVKRKKEKKSK